MLRQTSEDASAGQTVALTEGWKCPLVSSLKAQLLDHLQLLAAAGSKPAASAARASAFAVVSVLGVDDKGIATFLDVLPLYQFQANLLCLRLD